MVEAWIDIETTGLDSNISALVQLTMFVYVNDRLHDKYNFTFRPFPGDKVTKKALESTGHTIKSLMALDEPILSFSKYKGAMGRYVNPYDRNSKMMFYAYNAQFDYQFLTNWAKVKMSFPFIPSYFWWPPVDVASIVADRRKDLVEKLDNFKLSTVAQGLNIAVDEGKLHDAEYDIELTRAVYEATNI